ncbi:TMAO reductase system periplasmic protein TorT [Neopusillimonas maritima]|jgi:protein TorT|uniref:TMAO reductase system periplasmic protein TorT n=1 Tax=Neopusillimonas maritima TaxID=2026239 RepID=A0ABX9MYA9_9BURK|nr:TMAO reductase system periplasmic protein TorT [Neopusillimonas maritima]MBF23841.1 TMAO reductase system periplasmic protein TorT [Pusillimonas sp.]RII83528.1 TMAO reductase system periplasmic protein TorT [Neopusillimonas maritima]|tara:strand:- start:146228 stop:147313 length:1086 start_codon:yes stop_codon:yes gene_type:complete
MKKNALSLLLGGLLMTAVGAVSAADATDNWELNVKERTPPFSEKGEWKDAVYKPLPKSDVSEKWNICVLFPHTKDPYYMAMTYGAVTEAKAKGIALNVFAAGGYTELPTQISQLEDCVSRGADGIAMVAISATGLNRAIARAADQGVPTAITGGDVTSDRVAARAQGNWFDAGRMVGEYLMKKHPKGSDSVKVVWLGGPEAPRWSKDSADGFVATLKDVDNIEVVKVIWGEPSKAAQIPLIEDALLAYPDVDYIGGIAPAIEAGIQVLKEKGKTDIGLLSSYTTPVVEAGLRDGSVEATATDYTAAQARVAIDQLVRLLEEKPVAQDVDTGFGIIDQESVKTHNRALSLAPEGWEPYFEVK